ncbi:MAG: hypothetical protein HQK96_03480 [Nitrospirae bacterium]|nr:hypothetical protein [Nitrospirota bacterium]MBF0553601.1 hypothetical protein [Nitrospirota bacterium]
METVKRIVYFLHSPLTKFDEERFGISTFIENGFEVEVWEFTPFLTYDRYVNYTTSHKADFETRYIFHSKRDIISAISQLTGNCLIISMLFYNFKTIFIYREIARLGILYCKVFYNHPLNYNHPDFNKSKRRSLYDRVKNLTMGELKGTVFARIPRKYLGISPPDYLIVGGGDFDLSKLHIDEGTKIIRTHTLDYDSYLRDLKNPGAIDDKMAVFLDQYEPFHPDNYQPGGMVISPDEYYPLICRFFDYLQQNHSIHIVIAAHPRSDYANRPDYFGGRPVVLGKTVELVRKSKLVILHYSYAMNLGIIYKKPMIFVTMDCLEKSQIKAFGDRLINYQALLIGKRPLNLNETFDVDLAKELVVNEDLYERYKNIYIKMKGTDDIPTWQNLINHLRA